jgi:hypothetical protein
MGLESTIKQFLDSLLASKNRHTLCLNIADTSVNAEHVAFEYLKSKGVAGLAEHREPTPTVFGEQLTMIAGRHLVVSFDDLDKHPKIIDMLAEHVKVPDPGGKLVMVSRHWDSDNTEKERGIRKTCLFYQQNFAPPPKQK